MEYGFIGLGNLGGHLAASLLRAGMGVAVHDKDAALTERLVAAGARRADGPAALAEGCDAVITCLPSPAVSELVLDQILATMTPGSTWPSPGPRSRPAPAAASSMRPRAS